MYSSSDLDVNNNIMKDVKIYKLGASRKQFQAQAFAETLQYAIF